MCFEVFISSGMAETATVEDINEETPLKRQQNAVNVRDADKENRKQTVPSKTPSDNKDEMEASARRLRRLLRIYFHPAFKLTGSKCTINIVFLGIFIFQAFKLGWITSQMFNFGQDRGHLSSMVNKGETTLRHLLQKGWDATWEDLPYPPAHGEFAVYDIQNIVETINYAVERYYNVENIAIGLYQRIRADKMHAKIQFFDFSQCNRCPIGKGILNISELSFPIDKGLTSHINSTTNTTLYTYDIMTEFDYHKLEEPIKRLLLLILTFSVHSVRFFHEDNQALCLSIAGEMTFSDLDNNGQVTVQLNTISSKIKCAVLDLDVADWSLQRASVALANWVIICCSLGLVITLVKIIYAIFLIRKSWSFMKEYYPIYFQPLTKDERNLPFSEYCRFCSPWDLCITLADSLTLYGTTNLIFRTERREINLHELDEYVIWLAVGCFLAWFHVLRFVKVSRKFSLLFSTVYRAAPNVLAYIVCVVVLYVGFLFVGYVVLGPYHIKFSTMSKASETLAAVSNGDEIYTTFGILEAKDYGAIWWFCRFYLWTYIVLFTVIVLNLLIAIFMSAYETVKDKYEKKSENDDSGPVEKALMQFLENRKKNSFRSSIVELMSSSHKFDSIEEQKLRAQLSKICRISTSGDDVVLIKPRTLKAFMSEETDDTECNCIVTASCNVLQRCCNRLVHGKTRTGEIDMSVEAKD